MVKIQLNANKQFTITLPRPVIEAMNWKKGDDIVFRLGDDNTTLTLVRAKC